VKSIISRITSNRRRLSAFFFGSATLLPGTADAQGLPVDTGSHVPVAMWAVGTALLAIVLIYGIARNRQRTPSEKRTTERATKELYAEEARRESHRNANPREL
jgi:hypothetical protein